MPPYKTMYYHLFNAITDALKYIETQDYDHAVRDLLAAQQWGEDLYIEEGENTDE